MPGFRWCFQIMECDDARLLQEWVLGFHGLGVHFEIVPVVPSAEPRDVVAPFLESSQGGLEEWRAGGQPGDVHDGGARV